MATVILHAGIRQGTISSCSAVMRNSLILINRGRYIWNSARGIKRWIVSNFIICYLVIVYIAYNKCSAAQTVSRLLRVESLMESNNAWNRSTILMRTIIII
jgi:hypothetical protein